MKQIKAFVHRNRIGDIVRALEVAGYQRMSVIDSLGLLRALSTREQEYSVEIGEKVVKELNLELVCEDADVTRVVEIIRRAGRTGHPDAGWVFVSDVESAWPIES